MRKFSAEQIAAAYLSYATVDEAAKALGRSRMWLYRQLQREDVQCAIERLRAEAVAKAESVLESVAAEAALSLAELVREGSERSRLDAAKWILQAVLTKTGGRGMEIADE